MTIKTKFVKVKIMKTFAYLLLKYPKLVTVGIVLITGIFAFYALQVSVDPSNDSLLPQNDWTVRYLKGFNHIFGSDEVIVVALHAPQLLSMENLALLEALTDRISKIPDVTRVISLINFRDIQSDIFGPTVKVPFEEVVSGKKSLQDFISEVSTNPIVQNLLLSGDKNTTAILIDIAHREGDPFYRKKIVTEIRGVVAANSALSFYIAGIPVEVTDLTEYINRDQKIFLPLIFLTLMIIMIVIYRTTLEVAIPLLVMLMSLIWTIGLYTLNGKSLNAITTLLTPIVMVTSVENAIHFLNRYKEDFYHSGDRQSALMKSFSIIAIPCFLTSFTTAIGFASLMMNPIPAVRDFGIYASLGALFAYVMAMTVVPLILVQARIGKPGSWIESRWDRFERFLGGWIEIVFSKKELILIGTGAVLVISLSTLPALTPWKLQSKARNLGVSILKLP